MQTHRIKITVIAAFVGLLLLVCGCTMVGLAAGSLVDEHKPKQNILKASQFLDLKIGTRLSVTLNDGTTTSGKLAGLTPAEHTRFLDSYSQARLHGEGAIYLPAINDTCFVLPQKGVWTCCEFVDVSYGVVTDRWRFCFTVRLPDSNLTRNYCLDEIVAIKNSDGGFVTSELLNRLITDSDYLVPLAAVEIINDFGRQLIPIENIASVAVPNHRHGQLIGGLIGGILDAALISLAIGISASM